jgi:hypothetical protein
MKAKDKELLTELCSVLKVSKNNLRLDEYLDWNIFGGQEAKISTDGESWYLYLQYENQKRRWNRAKKFLPFMEVTQDGDDEGVLKMTGMPDEKQAETVRKYLRLRKVNPMTDKQREVVTRMRNTSLNKGVSASHIDLNEVGAAHGA